MPYGVIELKSDNILVFRPNVATFKEYNLEILKELRVEFVKITEGTHRPYMRDNSHITGLVTKEQKEYINKYAPEFATHMAIITHSPVMNFILNT